MSEQSNMWTSKTLVCRASPESKDLIWSQLPSPSEKPAEIVKELVGLVGADPQLEALKPADERLVCCYAAQHSCMFGDECVFSHDLARLEERGCQYGDTCIAGHWSKDKARQKSLDLSASQKSAACLRSLLTDKTKQSLCLECTSALFEYSDPLWEEVSGALSDAGEGVGDSDLSAASRQRLQDQGHYRSVNPVELDEWLFIAGQDLLRRLELGKKEVASQTSLVKALLDMLNLETKDALLRVKLMRELLEGCGQDYKPGQKESFEALAEASRRAADAAATVVDGHRQAVVAGRQPEICMKTVCEQVDLMQQGLAKYSPYIWPCKDPLTVRLLADGITRIRYYARRLAAQTQQPTDTEKAGTSLLELAKMAAQQQEYVIVHHMIDVLGKMEIN
eukprot:TRINITY_DN23062_c0_g2_i3.p1 TRINITY_DN23062_c0_g2~~TRINITY_DN23062_c0_g2_i3.p1  ORF type:complete len:393 (-),score=89.90 TRINITY_DN23062_c0_g2_i3:233-1411(-)